MRRRLGLRPGLDGKRFKSIKLSVGIGYYRLHRELGVHEQYGFFGLRLIGLWIFGLRLFRRFRLVDHAGQRNSQMDRADCQQQWKCADQSGRLLRLLRHDSRLAEPHREHLEPGHTHLCREQPGRRDVVFRRLGIHEHRACQPDVERRQQDDHLS